MRRITAALLGALHLLNGLAMLVDAQRWFARTAASSGPFNAHFVHDVGAAFLAASLGLLARSWRGHLWPAAVAGSVFLLFHALIHLVEFVSTGHEPATVVFLIAFATLALWSSLPIPGDRHV